MNKQLFLAKNIAHNTKASPDLLIDGEIGIFGTNAATYLSEKVGANVYEQAWIALGRLPKSFRISRAFDVKPSAKNLEWKKFPYSAPITKTQLVTTTCAPGKSQYDDFVLRVSVRFGGDASGQEPSVRSYHATGKFATARAVYDAWAVQIANDGTSADITATSSDAGLLVQGRTWDMRVDLGAEYYDNPVRALCATCTDCGFAITAQNLGDAGSGHYWHLRKLAEESSPYIGAAWNADRIMTNPAATVDSQVAAFGNADILYLKFSNHDQPKGDHGSVFNVFQEIFIAFPTGTDTAALETILNGLTGVTMQTSLAS